MTKKDLQWCKGCGHLTSMSGSAICNYAGDTGHCRSLICPPGFGCVCHTRFAEIAQQQRERCIESTRCEYKRIDKAVARAMYDSGANDREIADHFGCTSGAVRNWRRAYGLKSKQGRGSPAQRKDEKNGKGSSGTAI